MLLLQGVWVRILFVAILLVLLVGCSTTPDTVFSHPLDELPKRADYRILPQESTVLWTTQTLDGQERRGFVAMDQGIVRIDDRQIVSSTLVFDMDSFTVSRGPFDLHVYMNDYDYFDTFYYPEAQFSLRSLELQEDGSYDLRGTLEIVEITREVEMDAELFQKGKYFALRGQLPVDVLRWGIVQNQSSTYKELADTERIQDELMLNIEWVFEKT